jgi:hypothetical protein
MELSEVIFDLGIKGSRSHRDYGTMVNNWYIEENNPIPSEQLCLDTWLNVSVIRLREQRKLERILEVKELANLELLKTDWKIIKHQETNYLTPEQYFDLKVERNNIRVKSNEIETEINNLTTLEDVNNYEIIFN